MGLALYLLPVKDLHGSFGNTHTVLDLGGVDWDLGSLIRDSARRLPDGHDIQGHLGGRIKDGSQKDGRCYGRLVDDAYGEPYCWLTAKELMPVLQKHWPEHPATAYVRAMPSDNLIVLDWH